MRFSSTKISKISKRFSNRFSIIQLNWPPGSTSNRGSGRTRRGTWPTTNRGIPAALLTTPTFQIRARPRRRRCSTRSSSSLTWKITSCWRGRIFTLTQVTRGKSNLKSNGGFRFRGLKLWRRGLKKKQWRKSRFRAQFWMSFLALWASCKGMNSLRYEFRITNYPKEVISCNIWHWVCFIKWTI